MFRIKIFISIVSFSFLLIITSIVKNETREIEKKILNTHKKISQHEKDLNETQLDFFYLTSAANIEKSIENLDKNNYFPMEYSKIFLSLSDFIDLETKYAIIENLNEKKIKKK
tara:strand:+ start:76 stop:414 length:339 start_codon:yes stop_codon:yes gene_type:complete